MDRTLKKAKKKEFNEPVMEIPVAQLKIKHLEYITEPKEITMENGHSFTVDPQLDCILEVIDDFQEGEHDGATFRDRFKLKENDDGEWEGRGGTKLGALLEARYGRDYWDSDQEFDEADFEDFIFQAKVQEKKNPNSGQITGSMVNYETITAVPKPKKKGAKPTPVEEQAQQEEDEDFDSIPF